MKDYFKLMRPHHYVKNLLVFAALICSGQFFNTQKLFAGACGFAAFCMVSSAVYIINDIHDKDKDSAHPVKCKRPIASGAVSVKNARILLAVLLCLAAAFNALEFGVFSSILLLLYLVLNAAYSSGLKDVPLADVAILVSGFLIRVLYGALLTQIAVSNWLYLTVIATAFYFAFGKRRNELKRLGGGATRKVLEAYPVDYLNQNMNMCLTLANVFYALWSMDEQTVAAYNNGYLVLTVPIVMLITMKYGLDIEGDSDGDPVEVLLHDKALILLCSVYAVIMLAILYFI